MNSSLKDLTYLVSANAILKFLGIVSVMFFTRHLVKEELALIPLYGIMGGLSTIIFSFGILQTLVRDVPLYIKGNQVELVNSIIVTSLLLVIPGAFLFSSICFFLSSHLSLYFFNDIGYTNYIKLLCFGIFFSGINGALAYIYWSLSRYQLESSRMVLVGLIQVSTGIIFTIVWGIYGLIISLILTSFINLLLYLYYIRDILFATEVKIYPIRKLIIASLPFYLESYLMFFRAEGDQLFVASLLGPKALALYFIAKKPYDVLHSFTQSLDKILTTTLARLKNDQTGFNNKVSNIITLNSYLLFPFILLTVGLCPTLLQIIAGNGYREATTPSMVLLLWLLVQVSWKTALGKAIYILKSSTGRLAVTLIETVLLLSFMFMLGHIFGLNGVVVGRLLATISAGFCAYYLIRKKLTINIDIKGITTITLLSVIMCLFLLIAQYVFTSYLLIGLSLAFSVTFFLFLINRTISNQFYAVLNSISPIKIYDPFNILLRILNRL